MVLKYLLDMSVSHFIFHRQWSFINYFAPALSLTATGISAPDFRFYSTMLLISLPFVWAGSVLTVRRLRATQLPLWLVVTFFFPVANLVFFKVLTWLPSQTDEAEHALFKKGQLSREPETVVQTLQAGKADNAIRPWLDRLIPQDKWYTILAASSLPVLPAVALIYGAASFLGNYGWSLFIAAPFAVSILAPILYGYRKRRSYAACIQASFLALTLTGLAVIVFHIEGIVCLIMAMPLVAFVALLGGSIAYRIQGGAGDEVPKIAGSLSILLPFMTLWETSSPASNPTFKVTTRVSVKAAPHQVWHRVVSFPPMRAPEDLLFRAGIAYPTHATIAGTGIGAIRHCVFNTGTFVEPITVYQAPQLLRFAVTSQARPMNEMSLYDDLHPPHLDGYMISRQGQFLLKADLKAGTDLEGTTWYQNRMEPSFYWRLFSDGIIHKIHERVLSHVKTISENDVAEALGKGRKLTAENHVPLSRGQ